MCRRVTFQEHCHRCYGAGPVRHRTEECGRHCKPGTWQPPHVVPEAEWDWMPRGRTAERLCDDCRYHLTAVLIPLMYQKYFLMKPKDMRGSHIRDVDPLQWAAVHCTGDEEKVLPR